MSILSRLNRVSVGGQVSQYLNQDVSLPSVHKKFMRFGAWLVAGYTNQAVNSSSSRLEIDFFDYDTDTIIRNVSRMARPYCATGADQPITNVAGQRGSCGAMSNYRSAGYYSNGDDQTGSNIRYVEKLNFASGATSILQNTLTHRGRHGYASTATTNPGTAGYALGGYLDQNDTALGPQKIDKLLYSTEVSSVLSGSMSANRGITSGGNHNGTTAAYQMGGSTGAAGGYGNTNKITKVAYSTDTISDLAATLSVARDLQQGTQNSGTAGYAGPGRGNHKRFDKLTFSNETCAALASDLSNDAGAYSTTMWGNHQTAWYSAGAMYNSDPGDAARAQEIFKFNTSDTRSTLGINFGTGSETTKGFICAVSNCLNN